MNPPSQTQATPADKSLWAKVRRNFKPLAIRALEERDTAARRSKLERADGSYTSGSGNTTSTVSYNGNKT
jgi:hypothetical protein